jgi:hypothetical protein
MPQRRRRTAAFVASVVLWWPCARNAVATEGPAAATRPPATANLAPAAAAIAVDGSCPDIDALQSAVAQLVPTGVDALPKSSVVSVVDGGNDYRVEVISAGGRRSRRFHDPARDCSRRARFAGVFIVLTLLPPELSIAPEPPPPPPPVLPPVAFVAPPRPRARLWRLEVGAVADLAPAVWDGPSMFSPGGELRAIRVGRIVFASAAVGFEPRASFSVGGLSGRQYRFPFDLGGRIEHVAHRYTVAGELGVAGALFHAEGLNTAVPSNGTRLDLGARVGGSIRFGRADRRFAPFAGVHALIFPWPYEITAAPARNLGTTAALWLGITAGVSVAP